MDLDNLSYLAKNPPEEFHVYVDVDDFNKEDLVVLAALYELGQYCSTVDEIEGIITGIDIDRLDIEVSVKYLCEIGIIEQYCHAETGYTDPPEYLLAYNGNEQAAAAAEMIDLDKELDQSIEKLRQKQKDRIEEATGTRPDSKKQTIPDRGDIEIESDTTETSADSETTEASKENQTGLSDFT